MEFTIDDVDGLWDESCAQQSQMVVHATLHCNEGDVTVVSMEVEITLTGSLNNELLLSDTDVPSLPPGVLTELDTGLMSLAGAAGDVEVPELDWSSASVSFGAAMVAEVGADAEKEG